MHDQDCGADGVGEEKKSDGPFQRSFQRFTLWQADEEQADGDFGPHESREGLNPFAVGVFAELADFIIGEELLVFAEAVMDFDEIEGGADGGS